MKELNLKDQEWRAILLSGLILSILLHQNGFQSAITSFYNLKEYVFDIIIWCSIYSMLIGLNWIMIKMLKNQY